MIVLVDTNILGRILEPGHAQYPLAMNAVGVLLQRGDELCLVPQVLYELWVIATRPLSANGLGLKPQQIALELTRLESFYPLLPDSPFVYHRWKQLVTNHQVAGKNAHDTRRVVAMLVHGVTHVLTFNSVHFARYPAVTTIDPTTVVSSPNP